MGSVDNVKSTKSINPVNRNVALNAESLKLTMAKIVSAGQGIT